MPRRFGVGSQRRDSDPVPPWENKERYRIPVSVGPRNRVSLETVMAGLVPAIHVFMCMIKPWMPGSRPGMTSFGNLTSF
jgi:hypothetical protein